MASTRTFVLPALLLLLALPIAAEARSLDAPKAPPKEPVYEVDPGDRPGYTRVMGHWEWTGESFMWSPGDWVAEKEGYVWVADSWTQRGKKWHLTPGHYDPDGSVPTAEETVQRASEASQPHAMHPGPVTEEPKEITEQTTASSDEMDDVEKKVLAPHKKSAEDAKATTKHKAKHTAVKKQADYSDPKLYPYYKHH